MRGGLITNDAVQYQRVGLKLETTKSVSTSTVFPKPCNVQHYEAKTAPDLTFSWGGNALTFATACSESEDFEMLRNHDVAVLLFVSALLSLVIMMICDNVTSLAE